jgi:T5orf172 domain
LEQKDLQIEENKTNVGLVKELLREKTILEQFPRNTQFVYYGIIDDTNKKNEKFIKFGDSNNLLDRIKCHKHNFTNFRLIHPFKVDNKLHVENSIKTHVILSERRRSMKINEVNQTELLLLDNFSLNTLDEIIKVIIKSIEHSPENFVKLLEEN